MSGPHRPADTRAPVRPAWVLVALAATLPYLPTIGDYFVRDDFGVVQLLAGKPWSSFPNWFASSWMDEIWGYVPDEVRPFPALSYQLTALGGAATPHLHHALNIAIHAVNGLLVMALARRAAGLDAGAALFSALVFVLLPVHTESVAWITGRVDSMPTLFYLASFLAYVDFRQHPERVRLYVWSLILFFVALFSKQNTITMLGTVVGYDVLVRQRRMMPLAAFVRPYVPFAVMTTGYLGLRLMLFGEVAREGALTARGLDDFRVLVARHTRHVIAGDLNASAVVLVAVLGAVLVCWLGIRRSDDRRTASAEPGYGRRLLYFGPIWWLIGVLPIAVAGYHSPRHVYLAAVGWAVVLGLAFESAWRARTGQRWRRMIVAAAAVSLLLYALPLYRSIREWRAMSSVSHQVVRDVASAARSLPPGSLIVVGAPDRSWEWALPFAVRPPFQAADLRTRAFVLSPRALSCCSARWFQETRETIRAWSAGPARDSAVALRWDPGTGALFRASGTEAPQLPVLVRSLLQMSQPDELDRNLRRMIDVLPVAVE